MAQPACETTDLTEPGRPTGTPWSTRGTNMAGVTGAIRGRIRAAGAPVGVVPDTGAVPVQASGRDPVQELDPAPGAAPTHAPGPRPLDPFPTPPADLDASLVLQHGRWTAQRALSELPDTPAATIEVIDGSLVVSPRHGIRHQTVVLEFGIVLKRAARAAGYGMHPQVKIVVEDELVCPDLTVATRLGEDTSCVAAHEVLLVAEVVLADQVRTRRIDRTPIYAAGNIGHYLRLDFRGHDPVVSLYHLDDGEYRPVGVVAVGTRLSTTQPFQLDIDPAELRGRLVQPRIR